jgi:hypothetical protein
MNKRYRKKKKEDLDDYYLPTDEWDSGEDFLKDLGIKDTRRSRRRPSDDEDENYFNYY